MVGNMFNKEIQINPLRFLSKKGPQNKPCVAKEVTEPLLVKQYWKYAHKLQFTN